MADDFDSFWNAIGVPPSEEQQRKQARADKGLAFAYGLFDPIQRLDYFAKKAGEAIGIPGAEEAVKAQEAKIAAREAKYGNLAPGYTLFGNLISPAPWGIASGVVRVGRQLPRLAATAAGASTAASAPIQPGETYWGDVGTAATVGGVAGLGTKAVGSMLSPRIDPAAQELINRGVQLHPEMATTGITHDLLKTAEAAKSIVGMGRDDIAMNASFNTALANDILTSIKGRTTATTKDALVADIRQQVSSFYDDAFKKIGTILPTNTFTNEVRMIQTQANAGMNVKTQKALDEIIYNNIIRRFNVPTKTQGKAITGESLKDMNKYFNTLSTKLKDKAYDADVDILALEDAVKKLRGSVVTFTETADPNGLIRLANKARAEQAVFEKAAASSPGKEPFSVEDLRGAILSESDTATVAAGKGKLQEKARTFLDVMSEKPLSAYTIGRRTAMAGAILTGSTYAWLHNPIVATAAFTALGVAPAVIERAINNPAVKQKILGQLIKKHGVGVVANAINQEGQRNADKLRAEIDKWPDYTNPETNY